VIVERLLSLIRMYSEHVDNKDKEIIADSSNYYHLKHMGNRVLCLVDHLCGSAAQKKESVDSGVSNDRHELDALMKLNKMFVPNNEISFHVELDDVINRVDSWTTNAEIKEEVRAWVQRNQDSLSKFEDKWPKMNNQIQEGLKDVKDKLPFLQNLTPDQLLMMLDSISKSYKEEIDMEFTQRGLNNKVQELVNERNGILRFHEALRKAVPVKGVMDEDLTKLENSLAEHIAIFSNATVATPEQLENARIVLKNNLQMNLNGVDAEANVDLIHKVANNLNALLESDFGKSLNGPNLNYIIQRSINALRQDLENLKSPFKESNFILDENDVAKVADEVIDSLKQSRENNQAVILDMVDIHKEIQKENLKFSARPKGDDPARQAADLMMSYENYYYSALSSDQFYEDIQDYIRKYGDIYHSYVKPLQPFLAYSNAFQTMTAGLQNPDALGDQNPKAVRLLMATVKHQIDNLQHLSETDKRFFSLVNHLIVEWGQTKQPARFLAKLNRITHFMQCDNASEKVPRLLKLSQGQHLVSIFETFTDSLSRVSDNLATGSKSALGLVQTIGEGTQTVEKAAAEYHVTDLFSNAHTPSADAPPSKKPGFFARIFKTMKGWFGFRNLEIHYGVEEVIDSIKNLHSNMVLAKESAKQLENSLKTANQLADGVKSAASAFSSH